MAVLYISALSAEIYNYTLCALRVSAVNLDLKMPNEIDPIVSKLFLCQAARFRLISSLISWQGPLSLLKAPRLHRGPCPRRLYP